MIRDTIRILYTCIMNPVHLITSLIAILHDCVHSWQLNQVANTPNSSISKEQGGIAKDNHHFLTLGSKESCNY